MHRLGWQSVGFHESGALDRQSDHATSAWQTLSKSTAAMLMEQQEVMKSNAGED